MIKPYFITLRSVVAPSSDRRDSGCEEQRRVGLEQRKSEASLGIFSFSKWRVLEQSSIKLSVCMNDFACCCILFVSSNMTL